MWKNMLNNLIIFQKFNTKVLPTPQHQWQWERQAHPINLHSWIQIQFLLQSLSKSAPYQVNIHSEIQWNICTQVKMNISFSCAQNIKLLYI